jgi:hypothetical protein
MRRRSVMGLATLVIAVTGAGTVWATERTVTDFGDDGGPGQLRTVLADAALTGDVIVIPEGPPIVLQLGPLGIAKAVSIMGAGPGRTVVDGNDTFNVFQISAPAVVAINGLTIRNGRGASGGGVDTSARVRLTRVEVVGNHAILGGGGGISAGGAGELAVADSTIHDNESDFDGGGIAFNGLAMTLTNVTISGNRGKNGGGGLQVSGGTATLSHVTVVGNRAVDDLNVGVTAGGVRAGITATVVVSDTLIAGNVVTGFPGSPDCSGGLASRGSNLVQDPAGCLGLLTESDLTGLDPLLGPLAANGGPTPTHALLAGSPAIDRGSGACPLTDQRGVTRPQGIRCDIGAFERGGPGLGGLDFDGDGVPDVVVGAGRGDEPRVRVLSGVSGSELLSFLAYGPEVRSGVRVAVCDVTGDGVPDVVTAPGEAGPVRVFDGASAQPLVGPRGGFEAVPATSRSVGLTVGCLDVTGDGVPDIVVGVPGGPAAEARVLTFSGVDASPVGTAPAPGLRGPISVAP